MTTMNTMLAQTLWMPEQASTIASDVDRLMYFLLYLLLFFIVLIAGLMVFFVIRYRQKDRNYVPDGPTHNNTLEIVWSVIPTIILLFVFFWGFYGYRDMIQPPSNAYEITVSSYKWGWSFGYTHQDGYVESPHLHVPQNQPITLTLTSQDVIHSLFVPAFRVKKDAVPGRYNKMWFEATPDPDNFGLVQFIDPISGEQFEYENAVAYELFCAEYCGTRHSLMRSKVIVHTREGFMDWLQNEANVFDRMSPVEAGEWLYQRRGCTQCHSVDGSSGIGPSLKNLFGAPRDFTDGTSIEAADEEYIRESLLYPGRKITVGYPNQMPSYQGQLADRDIDALIAFMKSISEHYEGGELEPTEDEMLEEEMEAGESPPEGQSPDAPGGADDPPPPASEEVQEAEEALQG